LPRLFLFTIILIDIKICNLQKYVIVCSALFYFVIAEPPIQGVKPTNVIGSEQHTSFSFIRPGLTQTSFAFNGPSSHQSFASSIGNPQLAQKVLPSIAQALAYRNPGLGNLGLYLVTSTILFLLIMQLNSKHIYCNFVYY